MSALLRAVDALNDRLVTADCIGQSFDLAAGEDTPAWVSVYREQIELIRQASEAVETFVRRGDGGHGPHGDTESARTNDARGGGRPGAKAAAARPEKRLSLARK